MSKGLVDQWKGWSALFAARQKREKVILAFAALAVVWAVCDAVWLTPSLRLLKTHSATLSQKQNEVRQLEAQRAALIVAEVQRLDRQHADGHHQGGHPRRHGQPRMPAGDSRDAPSRQRRPPPPVLAVRWRATEKPSIVGVVTANRRGP